MHQSRGDILESWIGEQRGLGPSRTCTDTDTDLPVQHPLGLPSNDHPAQTMLEEISQSHCLAFLQPNNHWLAGFFTFPELLTPEGRWSGHFRSNLRADSPTPQGGNLSPLLVQYWKGHALVVYKQNNLEWSWSCISSNCIYFFDQVISQKQDQTGLKTHQWFSRPPKPVSFYFIFSFSLIHGHLLLGVTESQPHLHREIWSI